MLFFLSLTWCGFFDFSLSFSGNAHCRLIIRPPLSERRSNLWLSQCQKNERKNSQKRIKIKRKRRSSQLFAECHNRSMTIIRGITMGREIEGMWGRSNARMKQWDIRRVNWGLRGTGERWSGILGSGEWCV